jgi:hypothetical protein
MTPSIAAMATRLAATLVTGLRSNSSKVRALAEAEAASLATALASIASLLGRGLIDPEEAAVLLRIQKDASEAVLASLAEVSRVSAHHALSQGLRDLAGIAGDVLGGTLKSELLGA